jgi:N-succinyl-L-ornithine transcarbamylase
VANSFVEWTQAAKYELIITHPKGYELADEFVGNAQVEYNQNKALEGADFVYAKNWSSYSSYGKVLSTNPDWMITEKKMGLTRNAKFMHCLPVRRNVVAEDAVLDSPNSLVIPEATNRIYAMQVVLQYILEDLK